MRAALAVLAIVASARAEDPAEVVDRAEREVSALESRLKFVADEYTRKDATEAQRVEKRFHDAEIQFLLEDYPRASILLYDVAENATFKAHPSYPTALYYLGESLWQQKNFLAARPFFRQALQFRIRYQQECLLRLVQISDLVRDASGVEEYVEQVKAAGGRMRGEMQYVYAKWLHRRRDLPREERLTRAREAFQTIGIDNPFYMQARYFLGVLWVETGDLGRGEAAFKEVLKMAVKDKVQAQVHELTNLALGRIFYEQGKLIEAIDRYQDVPRESPFYNDALFEIAWSFVKHQDYPKALQATELLLLVAKGSLVEPEAMVLQGDLLTRMGKFKEAVAIYDEVVTTYGASMTALADLLRNRDSAVRFFDTLIRRGAGALEVEKLLPPEAMRWAKAQGEIGQAIQILGDLDAGKKGVQEAQELAGRLDAAVSEVKLEIFPTLQEGMARAVEVENSLIRLRQLLLGVETELYSGPIPPDVAREIAQRRAERESLEREFAALPQTAEDLQARRTETAKAFAKLDQKAYRLGYEAENLAAQVTAMEKWLADTREERTGSPSFDPKEERDLMNRLKQERAVAEQLKEDRAAMARLIADEATRARIGSTTSAAEQKLRSRYSDALERERTALARARPSLPDTAQEIANRVEALRGRMVLLEANIGKVRDQLYQVAAVKAQDFRRRVAAEMQLLSDYSAQVSRVEGDTSTLVGDITFGSFDSVRGQVRELVLKADVGLVDVAWAKKKEKSDKISFMAKTRDDDLKLLEEEFRDVLKEED